VLAWLKLWLGRDERYRALLTDPSARPACAAHMETNLSSVSGKNSPAGPGGEVGLEGPSAPGPGPAGVVMERGGDAVGGTTTHMATQRVG